MIKAVVFDIDNTLYDYDSCNSIATQELQKVIYDKYGINEIQFIQLYEVAKEKVKGQLGNVGAAHNRLLYLQNFLELIGEKPVKDALFLYNVYWDTMLENMHLYPYVPQLINFLQKKQIHIAVLTDLTAHIQHRKICKLGLDNAVDFIVSSEEAGVDKPSPKTFTLIIDKLKVMPEETLMIGDSEIKDIVGAKNFGMHAIHFDPKFEKDFFERCVQEINA